MNISNEYPPIWNKLRRAKEFGIDISRTIFTYGGTIYNPSGVELTDDLIAHESVHEKQQSAMGFFGPSRWWDKFIADPKFRFEQELEAYRAQYQVAKKAISSRERLSSYLFTIARELASPTYGNMNLNVPEVTRLIANEKH
jgi:hypothetical protein